MTTQTNLLLVLGATGPTGQLLVQYALARGYRVRAAVRSPEKLKPQEGLEIVKVDIFDVESLSQAFSGAEAVISLLGPRAVFKRQEVLTRSIRPIVEAMKIAEISRLVICSAQATVSSKEHPFLYEWVVRPLFLGRAMDDFHRMEEFLENDEMSRDINYTVVKPPRLIDGEATEKVQAAEGQYLPDIFQGMTRADVAIFMLNCFEQQLWSRKLVAISCA